MQVHNLNNQTNPNFGAIFKLTKNTKSMANVVIDAIKECTVPEEAEKIDQKFQIGGGSLLVYVPNAKLQELQNRLNRMIVSEALPEYITRVD